MNTYKGELRALKYLVIQRRNAIKALLIEKESVTINEVVDKFGISVETVRRDFDALAEEGFLDKIYGGATRRKRTSVNLPPDLLSATFPAEKKRIATEAVRLIKSNDTVFLDSSDTVLRMCDALMNKDITVLTNSLKVLEKLSESHTVRLLCIGGLFQSKHLEFGGTVALETLRQFQVDRAFITCRSLNFKRGIGTGSEDQAFFKKTVIDHAEQVNLLTLHSCFGKPSFVKFADYADIDNIFTDKRVSPEWKEFLESKSVVCHECIEEEPSSEEAPLDNARWQEV